MLLIGSNTLSALCLSGDKKLKTLSDQTLCSRTPLGPGRLHCQTRCISFYAAYFQSTSLILCFCSYSISSSVFFNRSTCYMLHCNAVRYIQKLNKT